MSWFDRLKKKPPVIMTQFGPVTEYARKQAALNMRDDPECKARVEKILVAELGVETGMLEARRRYPEAYQGETKH